MSGSTVTTPELSAALAHLLEAGWANTTTETSRENGFSDVQGRFTIHTGDAVSAWTSVPGEIARRIAPDDLVGKWSVTVTYDRGRRTHVDAVDEW